MSDKPRASELEYLRWFRINAELSDDAIGEMNVLFERITQKRPPEKWSDLDGKVDEPWPRWNGYKVRKP